MEPQHRARRAQSSLEFVSTYAWAFILLLIIIGVIAQLGLFDIGSFVPSGGDVVGFNTFGITRYIQHANGTMELDLVNTLDDRVQITSVLVNDVPVSNAAPALPYNLSAGGNMTFFAQAALNGTAGNGYTSRITIVFDVERGSAGHLDSGTLRSVFQP